MQNTPDPNLAPVLCPSPLWVLPRCSGTKPCSGPKTDLAAVPPLSSGAAGGAALPLPLPELLPAPEALHRDVAGLGPGTGLRVGLRAGCALLLGAHAHGECHPSPWDPLPWGQRDRAGILGGEVGTAPLQLCSWPGHFLLSPRTPRLAANSCALTSVPAHQVQQEQQAQGSGRWQQEAVLLVLPLVVSLLNALMPRLFNLLAMWEKQDSPVTQVYVAIIRWAGWGPGGGRVLHLHLWQAGRL